MLMNAESRRKEFAEKTSKLRAHMDQLGLDGLLLTQQSSVSWLTAGAETLIVLASVDASGPLLVTRDVVHLICPNIEAPRLLEEELAGLDIIDDHFPWHEEEQAQAARIGKIIGQRQWAKDTDPQVAARLVECFSVLSEAEHERYRWVGERSEEAIRAACRKVRPGMTEFEIAGILSAEAHRREIWPVLTLVAADDRLRKHRHPIATSNRLGHCVMLVLCARKWGLIANLSRLVHFGPMPEDLKHRHRAVCVVDATFIHETRPGISYGEIFRKAQAAYAEQGFADEWELHHQGGPSGYLGRIFKATPDSTELVQAGQSVAWNPSIAGTKSEDTILVHDTHNEFITKAREWPMLEVEVGGVKYERCDILVRSST